MKIQITRETTVGALHGHLRAWDLSLSLVVPPGLSGLLVATISDVDGRFGVASGAEGLAAVIDAAFAAYFTAIGAVP